MNEFKCPKPSCADAEMFPTQQGPWICGGCGDMFGNVASLAPEEVTVPEVDEPPVFVSASDPEPEPDADPVPTESWYARFASTLKSVLTKAAPTKPTRAGHEAAGDVASIVRAGIVSVTRPAARVVTPQTLVEGIWTGAIQATIDLDLPGGPALWAAKALIASAGGIGEAMVILHMVAAKMGQEARPYLQPAALEAVIATAAARPRTSKVAPAATTGAGAAVVAPAPARPTVNRRGLAVIDGGRLGKVQIREGRVVAPLPAQTPPDSPDDEPPTPPRRVA